MQNNHYSRNQLIVYQCEKHPYAVISALNSFKLRIQISKFIEQKFIHLFHICVLIEKIVPFLVSERQHLITREFFFQDLVYFFYNAIINENNSMELKTATCNYFFRFLKQILPVCADQLRPFLNHIVSALVPLIKGRQAATLSKLALDILQFLIVDQKEQLRDAIGTLDNFPADGALENMRAVHIDAKYNGRQFTLIDEIEYFLKVDKRKIEGLIALKEQVRQFVNNTNPLNIYVYIYIKNSSYRPKNPS